MGDSPGRAGDVVALPREEEVGSVLSLALGGADAALVLGSQNGIFEMSPYGATYQIGDPSNPPLDTSDTPDT
ncbi:hypothetical protein J4H86_23635 [Spiractinospora alimapuensis]|uniref:hypothetical protein n=1 Tax=Spiractinospora alimapuensis TaxID=2820884 RepID=UPI001F3166E7|nr:hypothetical protein [Spiractinospora alimapuensis]QVQ51728.1 hypothetical protein J4H86_23635 [Spiractinospora alimapuensis]